MLVLVGNGLIVLSAVLAAASLALQLRVPWWESPMGRHLVAYMAVTAVILSLAAARVLWGDSPGWQVARLVAFSALPVVLGWRLVLQVRAQRRPRGGR